MSKIDTLKRYYHYYGMKMLLLKLFRNHSAENFDYDLWLKKNTITEAELEKQKKYEFIYNPKISIIVPTYETPEIFLRVGTAANIFKLGVMHCRWKCI